MEIIDQLKSADVMSVLKQTGAVMEGHFKLTSGFHSRYYLQCAKLLQYPAETYSLVGSAANEFTELLNPANIDTIVSPAMGGILFGYMLGLKLSKKMIYTERKDGQMQLRRGFELLPGEKVLIAEDVITTGGSVVEVIDICKNAGADIKGVICIVDRSQNLDLGYPLNFLIKLDVEKFDPEKCPLCASGIDIYYPGSRK